MHFRSLNDYYREKFGCKIVKVSLDAGFTCPNKDGTKNIGGCIFCNGSTLVCGKGDVVNQFYTAKKVMDKKWKNSKYIVFLEANTNTYGSISKLKSIYEKLIALPDVVGLNIATRCDAISNRVYDYLEDLNKRTFLTIELGLQSAKNETLKFLNRGHTREEFTECVKELKRRNIEVVVHIINGIPTESEEDMLETIKYLNNLGIDGIKFHMLYIEHGTKLAQMYLEKPFKLLTRQEYIQILSHQIQILNPNIVVHRLTSDPNREKLIEPKWLENKFITLNEIDKYFSKNKIYQGEKVIMQK